MGLAILFVAVRGMRFLQGFHFLHDQALFSDQALTLWQAHKLSLIGPPTSLTVSGRQVFQGGAIYYFWALLMLPTNWDPYGATWLMVLLAAVMLIPLYGGVKRLAGTRGAVLVSLSYCLYPDAILATSELWNPYLQFALVPVLVYLFSRAWERRGKRRQWWSLLLGIWAGFLLQFHYQFLLVVPGLLVLLVLKRGIKPAACYLVGTGLGFGNMLLFELRNHWYNLTTAGLILSHFWEAVGAGGPLPHHYVLSVAFLLLVVMVVRLREFLTWRWVVIMGIGLALTVPSTLMRVKASEQALSWSYRDELKTYAIIKGENLTNYNVTAWYQAIATPERYLHRRDGIILPEDYRANRYLFVIYPDESWAQNSAYEMNSFGGRLVKSWPINGRYQLYLLAR